MSNPKIVDAGKATQFKMGACLLNLQEESRSMPKEDTQFKPGQSGNPKGRKKGSRNKLTKNFINIVLNLTGI